MLHPLLKAYDLGILRKGHDDIILNQGRRIAEAKQSVIELFDNGYTMPVPRKDVRSAGPLGAGRPLRRHQRHVEKPITPPSAMRWWPGNWLT